MWEAEAETFDEAADHGLRDPRVRAAWRLLLDVLPRLRRPWQTWDAAPGR